MVVGAGIDTLCADEARKFNLLAPPDEYFDDPSKYFKLLRDHDPVHKQADGTVLLSRYEDVRQIWRDLTGLVFKGGYFKRTLWRRPSS
ncbi:hypothetical protein [Sphingomonas sp. Ant20]|uniref:hypothetical protein n=1 Tax=Sphingomonas sp. Ant20 TaxID=104605 RepID=UPI0018E30354|nr:hypothetical protein [Sphingomonas sp. Ant20]